MAEADPFSVAGPRSESGSNLSRREFVKAVGAAATAAALPLVATPGLALGASAPPAAAPGETAVGRLYRSLRDDQRKALCFPFDHPLRNRVENNWAVVRPAISDLDDEQQALCLEIFRSLCSDEGYERFRRQMDDDSGGFANYHVALFGTPGTEQPFEWVLTGRHVTLRADGRRAPGSAFGGPIFYGHAAQGRFHEDAQPTGNVWWYQGAQANRIFASLDPAQQAQALVSARDDDARRAVRLKGKRLVTPGIAVAALDAGQKQMVQQLLRDLTRPFRTCDAEEIQQCLRDAGGADRLRLTFFREGDIDDDRAWDVWKLEGPAFAWYFHGTPHVHAWLNFARPGPATT
jgi:hypothetical protein